MGGWFTYLSAVLYPEEHGFGGHGPGEFDREGGTLIFGDAVLKGALRGWVGGCVGYGKVEEKEAVRMSYCGLGLGGWVGGWVGEWVTYLVEHVGREGGEAGMHAVLHLGWVGG